MEILDKELHRIVPTAIIYKPDFTYLILKRAPHKKVMPNKWGVPGGGLSTDDYSHIPSALTFIRPDGIPVLCLSYFTPYVSGEVKIDEDHIEFAWVTAQEAESYDLIEGILGEIKEVDKILKRRKTM